MIQPALTKLLPTAILTFDESLAPFTDIFLRDSASPAADRRVPGRPARQAKPPDEIAGRLWPWRHDPVRTRAESRGRRYAGDGGDRHSFISTAAAFVVVPARGSGGKHGNRPSRPNVAAPTS